MDTAKILKKRDKKDEDLAIQTQFHIAESYFELFKGHRKLKHDEEKGRVDEIRRIQAEHGDDGE